jgi:hypothetical protein
VRRALFFACALFGLAHAGQSEDLIEALRAASVPVTTEEEVEQPFFAVKGKVITVYGDAVQVFEYPSPAAAEKDAARVSPDGRTIGTTKPHWLGPPHFYRKDTLIVLYLGDDREVLRALEARLGRQFAGD